MNNCPGCDFEDDNSDHIHQYTTVLGGTYTCYYIEGKSDAFAIEAVQRLEKTAGFTRSEALQYLQALPRRYN